MSWERSKDSRLARQSSETLVRFLRLKSHIPSGYIRICIDFAFKTLLSFALFWSPVCAKYLASKQWYPSVPKYLSRAFAFPFLSSSERTWHIFDCSSFSKENVSAQLLLSASVTIMSTRCSFINCFITIHFEKIPPFQMTEDKAFVKWGESHLFAELSWEVKMGIYPWTPKRRSICAPRDATPKSKMDTARWFYFWRNRTESTV